MNPTAFTPGNVGCIYTTRRGTLYQLSDHNQKLFSLSSVQLNLSDFLDKKYIFEMLEENKINFKKYLNLEKYENYFTIYSASSQKKILGTNKETAVKLFVNGYKEFDIQTLIKYADLCGPDVIVAFSEIPDIASSGQKSNKRAFIKNFQFLKQTLEKFKPEGKRVLAPIVAMKFHEILEQCVKDMETLEPDGYAIQGLYQGETFEERDAIFSLIAKTFGENEIKNKHIVLSSKGEPVNVLHALFYGIRIFESEYPFLLAEKGLAFGVNLYDYELLEIDNSAAGAEAKTYSAALDKNVFKEGLVARFFTLSDKSHKLAVAPLIPKCECYTCKNHTQAYIHHLLECDEMTANVLLTIHNLFTYEKFMGQLRQCESQGKTERFIQWFMDTQCIETPVPEVRKVPETNNGTEAVAEPNKKEAVADV